MARRAEGRSRARIAVTPFLVSSPCSCESTPTSGWTISAFFCGAILGRVGMRLFAASAQDRTMFYKTPNRAGEFSKVHWFVGEIIHVHEQGLAGIVDVGEAGADDDHGPCGKVLGD